MLGQLYPAHTVEGGPEAKQCCGHLSQEVLQLPPSSALSGQLRSTYDKHEGPQRSIQLSCTDLPTPLAFVACN